MLITMYYCKLKYKKVLFYSFVLVAPQTNSWQLETTNQDSTNTVNTPMDCKGKILI